jgi:alkylation response protein AidB-like acyl-CoA dehydrogenase
MASSVLHPVTLVAPGRPSTPGPLVSAAARIHPLDVSGALLAARELARDDVSPGGGATRDLWEALATLAASDLGVARAIEPHLDAAAILRQADNPALPFDGAEATWGVFAAEGPGEPLRATPESGEWQVDGTKPWCSLASVLSAALVTATRDDGDRQLFAVDLRHPGLSVVDGVWEARGLSEIPSGPVVFAGVPATPVGAPGWYLRRPGFAFGGIGVAACWFGGAVGIARDVFATASTRTDPFRSMHLGAIDALLEDCRRALAEAADLIDDDDGAIDGGMDAAAASLLAKRVRATVARACEEIIDRAGHALGPTPLALDADYAKRIADLQLYVRQHHAEKDQASLGDAVLRSGNAPW